MAKRAGAAIDDDNVCQKWLLSGPGAVGQATATASVEDLLGNSLLGVATVTGAMGTNNASVGSGYLGMAIVFNLMGSSFNANAPTSSGEAQAAAIGALAPTSEALQVFTLIHELAHLYGVPRFLSDNRNVAAGLLNNDMVWEKCKKAISSFGHKANRP